jgi:uncharacterized membrane protein YqjE
LHIFGGIPAGMHCAARRREGAKTLILRIKKPRRPGNGECRFAAMALLHVSTRHPETVPHPGAVESVKKLIPALARYANARMRLLALETRLAVRDVKTGMLMFGIAALLAGTAFFVLVTALVLWLAEVLPQGNGAAACAIVAGLFILVAGFLFWRGRQSFKGRSWLPATRTEFKTDKQWLKEL